MTTFKEGITLTSFVYLVRHENGKDIFKEIRTNEVYDYKLGPYGISVWDHDYDGESDYYMIPWSVIRFARGKGTQNESC